MEATVSQEVQVKDYYFRNYSTKEVSEPITAESIDEAMDKIGINWGLLMIVK